MRIRIPQAPGRLARSAAKTAVAVMLALLVLQSGLPSGGAGSLAADDAARASAGAADDAARASSDAPSGLSFDVLPAVAADLSASAMRLRWESPARGLNESARSRLRTRAGLSFDGPPPPGRTVLRPPYDPVEGRSARSSSLRLLLQTAQLAAG